MDFEITQKEIDEMKADLPLFELLLEHFEASDEFDLKVVKSLSPETDPTQ